MSENFNLMVALLTGLVLGTIFYYGLWQTLQIMKTSKTPAFLFIASAFSRISITLVGFYLVTTLSSENKLLRILLCLLAFSVARFIITTIIKGHDEVVNNAT